MGIGANVHGVSELTTVVRSREWGERNRSDLSFGAFWNEDMGTRDVFLFPTRCSACVLSSHIDMTGWLGGGGADHRGIAEGVWLLDAAIQWGSCHAAGASWYCGLWV